MVSVLASFATVLLRVFSRYRHLSPLFSREHFCGIGTFCHCFIESVFAVSAPFATVSSPAFLQYRHLRHCFVASVLAVSDRFLEPITKYAYLWSTDMDTEHDTDTSATIMILEIKTPFELWTGKNPICWCPCQS